MASFNKKTLLLLNPLPDGVKCFVQVLDANNKVNFFIINYLTFCQYMAKSIDNLNKF